MDLDHLSETRRNLGKLLSLHDRISTLGETLNADPDDIPVRLDIFDDGDALHVIAEVPGVAQDKLEVAIVGRELTIAGLREALLATISNESISTIIQERAQGHFQRTLTLPSDVDRDGGTAQLREGLLILHLPKVSL